MSPAYHNINFFALVNFIDSACRNYSGYFIDENEEISVAGGY